MLSAAEEIGSVGAAMKETPATETRTSEQTTPPIDPTTPEDTNTTEATIQEISVLEGTGMTAQEIAPTEATSPEGASNAAGSSALEDMTLTPGTTAVDATLLRDVAPVVETAATQATTSQTPTASEEAAITAMTPPKEETAPAKKRRVPAGRQKAVTTARTATAAAASPAKRVQEVIRRSSRLAQKAAHTVDEDLAAASPKPVTDKRETGAKPKRAVKSRKATAAKGASDDGEVAVNETRKRSRSRKTRA